MSIAILGNSGSGKSTLAGWLSVSASAPLLDLDSVAWVPGKTAVARPLEDALADVDFFCSSNHSWIVEGCYATLVGRALMHRPLLLFLNPGVDRCIANCRARPWEPHKYKSRLEQDERLNFLLTWVREYYSREGDMSLSAHRSCFDAYAGPKQEVTDLPNLDASSSQSLNWLTSTIAHLSRQPGGLLCSMNSGIDEPVHQQPDVP